jgi:hypothetical protein
MVKGSERRNVCSAHTLPIGARAGDGLYVRRNIMGARLLSTAAALAFVIAAAHSPTSAQVSGGADASVGDGGASAGVGASVGGAGGVAAGADASVGGGGASAGVGASVGGTGSVSGGGGASVGGGGASAGIGASTGGTGGVTGDGGASVGGSGATAGTSGTAALAPTREAGAIDAIGRLAGLSPSELLRILAALDREDRTRLKITCAEVLRNPAAYSPSTRAICEVIAAL